MKYYDDMKEGDILLTYKRGNIFSEIIYRISKKYRDNGDAIGAKVSHAAIYLGNGKLAEVSFGGLKIVECDKYSPRTHVITLASISVRFDRTKIIDYVKSHVGKVRYGWLTLFMVLIKKMFRVDKIRDIEYDAQICIEFVVQAYRDIYAIDLVPGIDSWMCDPIDLLKSKLLYVRGFES